MVKNTLPYEWVRFSFKISYYISKTVQNDTNDIQKQNMYLPVLQLFHYAEATHKKLPVSNLPFLVVNDVHVVV